ncbi:MAG: sialate O-acetylesterase [Candidatus Pseudobacter hemicellulosilyticus]|uniref:Sialate O-acetylesterase n=1 Tax=Candidatus Pseudobacter hemicellulosilyticus TaxID=3121375 RepID=A0AAJ6BIP1_9BACT|nr:MAG: sialate O-acetylesterase [Pseudobacter sp.]
MKRLFMLAAACCLAIMTQAKIVLPSVFSDNMVLQQKSTVKIWGKSEAGKTVTVTTSWNQQTATATVDNEGKWQLTVSTPSFGGPYEIVLTDGEPLTLKNILIGDVWVCSGQSNMEMPLAGWGKVDNYEQEIKEASYPQIRLLQAKHMAATRPQDDLVVWEGGWQVCSPQTIPEFSSTAYFFAREIYKKTGVPIGLLHTSWGGTIIEAWTSGGALKKVPQFTDAVAKIEAAAPEVKGNDGNRASVLFNAMIHPIINFRIKGVIWYQGESNADRLEQAQLYRTLFPNMINDWRNQWGQPELPFYFVQLAAFSKKGNESAMAAWPILREAQASALSLPHTGMAVAIDIGHPTDIHPKNKQDVGRRLAYIALAKDYGQKIEYSGPVVKKQVVKFNTIELTFDHAKGLDLRTSSGIAKGWLIAGADQQFHPAEVSIKGNKITVHSTNVSLPAAVRYAWADDPDVNLYNKAGLPASPFRTDKW